MEIRLYLSDTKSLKIREIIRSLYTTQCSAISIDSSIALITDLVDADYHALIILPSGTSDHHVVISNNPSGFMDTYMTVIKKDFLLEAIVERGTAYVMRQDSSLYKHENQEFIEIVQKPRPISDLFYMPIHIDSYFFGYWAIGRAGPSSPFFTDEESDIFRFLSPFVNEILISTLRTPSAEDSAAYLDYAGYLIISDLKFQCTITECYYSQDIAQTKLQAMFLRFLHGPMHPGMDTVFQFSEGKTYAFKFKFLPGSDLRPKCKGIPFASVTLSEINQKKTSLIMPSDILLDSYKLTSREMQVVKEITRGFSNKKIAKNLGVDESTVKRHTHNIYEKTGFRSRVELILGLKTKG